MRKGLQYVCHTVGGGRCLPLGAAAHPGCRRCAHVTQHSHRRDQCEAARAGPQASRKHGCRNSVRWLGRDSGDQSASPAGKTALDILKDRFARGEINKAEFEERKKLLSD